MALSEKSKKLYTDENYTLPTALILGAEDTGISPEVLRLCHSHVQIPMKGQIQSLNVSVAAGIVVYEGVKSRI